MDFLDFEQPIVELERRIEELKLTVSDSEFSEDINNCYKKKDEIVANLSEVLEDFKKIDRGTFQALEDETGKSTMTAVEFHLKNGEVGVTCSNYSSEFKIKNNYADSIRVDISTKEFSDWLRYEAY